MRNIGIYGAGGFGREVALMIRQINEQRKAWNVIGFFDDGKSKGDAVDDLPVLGGLAALNAHKDELDIAIGIADPGIRRDIANKITNANIRFPVLIHPSVMVGDESRNRFGEGTIITAGNILTTNIHLGRFVLVNLACTIGHDVTLHDFCSIMPGCSLSGFIEAEEGTYIGAGAVILPNLTIGKYSRIGAGAVVTRHVEENKTVMGVPAVEK
jgi:sugar O-acyltransferase (sialic acid O-acetyltransferase NeuD family)